MKTNKQIEFIKKIEHIESDFKVARKPIRHRPRRNRVNASIRKLVKETHLSAEDLIMPLFVMEGKNQKVAIKSMPGQYRLSIDKLVELAREGFDYGVPAVALFPVIDDRQKDRYARESVNADGLLQRTIRELKDRLPDLAVITDVAMDPYSTDGHDGLVHDGQIINDATLDILAAMAVAQADAGADIVAPSDMMDGRIGYIREVLDQNGFENTGILSYAVKYASAFYGPFREALDSAPRSGDKKTYQMDPANRREAIREVILDVQQGADMVMVKPGMPYLDVISDVRKKVQVPVAAYQVSGEYAMIKAAAQNGWIDEKKVMQESLLAIKRAGADMILTYYAVEAAKLWAD